MSIEQQLRPALQHGLAFIMNLLISIKINNEI